MLRISNNLVIPETEIIITAIRAQGPGGQNVNKVASAIHLRFDIPSSTVLSDEVKTRLLALQDRRITADGVVNIKAQRSRSQEKNRVDALRRLGALVEKGLIQPKVRRKTKPGRKAKEKRLADKVHRGKIKKARARVIE